MSSGWRNLVKEKYLFVLLLVLFLSLAVLQTLIVFKPWGTIFGVGDAGGVDFGEYFFLRNLSFGWLPRIDFHREELLYPYGMEFIAHGWAIERHLFTGIFNHWFGIGPWLQLYCALSLPFSGLLAWVILGREVGRYHAAYVAFIVSFVNAAALFKYPGHLNLSVLHWSVASVCIDFALARRLERGVLSWRFLLARSVLVFASLGLDVGYIAGLGLSSLAITIGWALIVHRKSTFAALSHLLLESRTEIKRRWGQLAFLGGLSLFLCWLYVPILAQVMIAYRQYSFPRGAWYYASPLRLFLPWLPGADVVHNLASKLLGDTVEVLGNMSPGWLVVVPGIGGLLVVLKERLRSPFAPAAIFFLLCILNHPQVLPVMHLFPWFREARVAGRLSLIFPALLSILSLAFLPWLAAQWQRRAPWIYVAGGLALVEWLSIEWHSSHFMPHDPLPWNDYFETVKKTKGKALFEWPFCVAGGNGVASEQLCPFFGKNASTLGLARLHQKYTNTVYLGRLSDAQVKPLVYAGWPELFGNLLGPVSYASSGEQRNSFARCLNQREWDFLTEVLAKGDYAGVQLYVDLLGGEECAAEFYRRIGAPAASVDLPGVGRTEFLPKPAAWYSKVDENAARSLRFLPSVASGTYDLLSFRSLPGFRMHGVSGLNTHHYYRRPVRLIQENSVEHLEILLDRGGESLDLQFVLATGVARQPVEVWFNNDKVLADNIVSKVDFVGKVRTIGKQGKNVLSFRFPSAPPTFWNTVEGYRLRHGTWLLDPVALSRQWRRESKGIYAVLAGLKVSVGGAHE